MSVRHRHFLGAVVIVSIAAAGGALDARGQTSEAHARRGIAMVIGLNRVSADHYGSEMPLRGCVNDANDIFAIARAQRFECFEPLLDEKGTRAEVADNIRKAAAELKSGDLFLLHYSGHGSSIADRNGDEPDKRDETWCLFDGLFVDDELNLLWAEFKPGVRIAVLSDSCHSGTVTRGNAFKAAIEEGDGGGQRGKRGVLDEVDESALSFRFIPDDQADATVKRHQEMYDRIFKDMEKGGDEREVAAGDPDVRASILLISGCQDNQVSGDLPANGVFTGAMKRTWNNGQFNGGWRPFHGAVASIMPQTQSPNFYPTGNLDQDFWAQRPFTP